MISGHGGNIYVSALRMNCRPADIIDMSSNMNPLGPPPGLLDYLKAHLDVIARLPEVDSCRAIAAFAASRQIDPAGVLAGNGTTQFIYSIPAVLESERVLVLAPTYSDYADACRLHHVACRTLVTEESMGFQPDLDTVSEYLPGVDTVFLCNPNNPTGTLVSGEKLQNFCRSHSAVRFIIDESYLPFVPRYGSHSLVNARLDNVVVLTSVSKIFRIPGLRIGFIIGTPGMMNRFRRHLLPWSMNSLAQSTVEFLATHRQSTERFVRNSQQYFEHRRAEFAGLLKTVPEIDLYPGRTPFVLMKLINPRSAASLQNYLDSQRILVRNCANFSGLTEHFIRVSLKSSRINRMLADLLVAAVREDTDRRRSATQKRLAV